MWNEKRVFWVFILLFFAVWTVRVSFYTAINVLIPLPLAVNTFLLKFFLWIVPIILYMIVIDGVKPADFLQVSSVTMRTVRWCGYILIIGVLWEVGLRMLEMHRGALDWGYWLNVVLGASLFEEMMFRGFVMNKLRTWGTNWYAIVVSSVLFALIHVPGWWLLPSHNFSAVQLLTTTVYIFIFPSLTLGWLLKKSESLYPSILFHAIHNAV